MTKHTWSTDCFCYVCAKYIVKKSRREINDNIRQLFYEVYCKNLRNENFCPTIVCSSCYASMLKSKSKSTKPRILIPPTWRAFRYDHTDCFFCNVQISKGTFKTTFPIYSSINLPIDNQFSDDFFDERDDDLLNSNQNNQFNQIAPSPLINQHDLTDFEQNQTPSDHFQQSQTYSDDFQQNQTLSTPFQQNQYFGHPETFRSNNQIELTSSNNFSTSMNYNQIYDPTFRIEKDKINLDTINQEELNDLVKLLYLTKTQSEELASFLKSKNLLDGECRITNFRTRADCILHLFENYDNGTAYMRDINGFFEWLQIDYNPNEWRLFIDSSLSALKGVLIHIRNEKKSIPIFYSSSLKESYENLKLLLNLVDYYNHEWLICGDFKVINILLGLQLGHIKKSCFLCQFDSRDKTNHYKKKHVWPARCSAVIGENNQINPPLIKKENVILPPLHIKLGLFKQFVKGVFKNGNEKAWFYLASKFPNLSPAKIKEGIFNGPQIRKIMEDDQFEKLLKKKEKDAWRAFVKLVNNFLGNERSKDFKKLAEKLVKCYKDLDCNMSLKLHMIDRHMDFFRDNCGDYSEEHGERFHQEIKVMESRYNSKFTKCMMADYCWCLKLESRNPFFIKKKQKKNFF